LAIGSAVVVVGLEVALVVVKAMSTHSKAKALPAGATLSAIVSKVTTVPASTLAAAGSGPASGSGKVTAPSPLSGQPALTQNGKPQIVYIGVEYCFYCVTERWAMAVALSRFGTFSNLGATHSDANDVYPNTSTLTFYKSSYTSKYIVFSPVEEQDPNKKPLQTPTAQQQALVTKYDAPPYVPSGSQGSIPFIDIGNKFLISGASFSPQLLQGKTWAQIAAALSDPSNPIGKSVGGTANYMTAAICSLTKNQPANVCSAPSITALNGKV